MNRGVSFALVLLLILSFVSVTAQSDAVETDEESQDFKEDAETEEDVLDELEREFEDEDLDLPDEGLTPDSPLYFLDGLFESRGEKAAEIEAMLREGKVDEAREAYGKYKSEAEKFAFDVSPEERDEARREAASIRKALKEFEDEHDFVSDVFEEERKVVVAAEVASKIRELCVSLADLDPLEYSRVCRVNDGEDVPDWRRQLDNDLTDKQREDALKFGEIMESCFETSGQECDCEEIPHAEMSAMCSVAAPLAFACDVEGDEEACERMDSLEMPELPDYLQDVLDDLEDSASARFDIHMPEECREAGINLGDRNAREDCMRIMIATNAPEECRDALEEANPQSEREARDICEEIMFEIHAPQECVDEGIRGHEECSRFMWEVNAPQECIDAGLTGEHRSDHRECERIMRSFEGDDFKSGRDGGGFSNCASISDPKDRLDCFDGAVGRVGDRRDDFDRDEFRENYRREFEDRFKERARERFGDRRESEDRFRERFDDHEGNFDDDFEGFSPDEFDDEFRDDFEGDFNDHGGPQDFEDHEESQEFEGDFDDHGGQDSNFDQEGPQESSSGGSDNEGSGGSESGGDSGDSGGDNPGPTGAVIGITGNAFLDYFWN